MDKNYDAKKVELGKEDFWDQNHYHEANKPENKHKKPFSMIVPPPNVTGILHIGHALNTVTLDVVARYKRLRGYDVLFLPAMDHAGIATQAVVEKKLRAEGIDKYQIGREKFLEYSWQWKEKYGEYIHKQWKALGIGMDFTKERFTLDEKANYAVNKVFKTLYDQGLIYQGERIINWDPELNTALSNIEIEHKEVPGKFYYFKYRFANNPEKFLEVATTRPETMFGDTAVVFNPKDERYKGLEGEYVINPANGEKLPLIGDIYVDISFGTGVMKCTPAHDPNDFEIAKRHNLAMPKIMNLDGTMNENCPKEYQNLDRYAAREKVVEKIKNDGNLIKIEDIVHQVGHSERSHVVVEPMLSKQWFIKMKPLVEDVLSFQKSKDRTHFLPSRFTKIFERWLKDADDWCISRQLWWGHRIPVYTNKETGEVVCSETPLDSNLYKRDEDVLDTWFSSALAPFAFLGWPESTDLLERFYPLDVMITAYDIIFFWVARMSIQGVHFTDKMPFKTVFIHGLVRDTNGKKMSKSSGNGIDPFEVIDKYGCDSLRYSIVTGGTPGLDISYSTANIEFAKAYLNKVWNASRFLLTSIPDNYKFKKLSSKDFTVLEHYLFNNFNETIKKVKKNMDNYELGLASQTLYAFVYDVFCSNYVEMVKHDLKNGSDKRKDVIYSTLVRVIKDILVMLFPFAPFISEEIYSYIPNHLNSIYEEKYPTILRNVDKNKAQIGTLIVEMVKFVRNFKMENKLGISSPVDIDLSLTAENEELFDFIAEILKNLVFAKEVRKVSADTEGLRKFASIGLKVNVDKSMENDAIEKRIAYLNDEIAFLDKMLNNPNFVSRAKKEVVDQKVARRAELVKELESYKK